MAGSRGKTLAVAEFGILTPLRKPGLIHSILPRYYYHPERETD
jgi:hypothetical protein